MVNEFGTWRIENAPHGHVPNNSESEDEQWLLGFDEKGGDVFLKEVAVVAKDQRRTARRGKRNAEKHVRDSKARRNNASEKLKRKVRKVNELLNKIESKVVTEDNDLFYLIHDYSIWKE